MTYSMQDLKPIGRAIIICGIIWGVVIPSGNADFDSNAIRATVLGSIDLAEDVRPVVRRVTISTENNGLTTASAVNGDTDTATTPTTSADFVLGTSLWSNSTNYVGRHARTVRLSHAAHAQDPHIEVRVDGGDRRVEASIDIELAGQGKGRRDKNG